MIKIWAKLIKNNKLKKDYVYLDEFHTFSLEDLREYLLEICYQFDLENPVILQQHLEHLIEYRMTRFLPEDFLDEFPYDRLEIHNLSE